MASQSDLQKMINDVAAQIDSLGETVGIEPQISGRFRDLYAEENERMERYLSDFTSRQGILLVVAGLLVGLLDTNKDIKFFLVWSIPFLIGAVIAYIVSSKRVNFVSKDCPISYRSMVANEVLKDNYLKSMLLHKIGDVLTVVFLLSFILNYYLVTFTNGPILLSESLLTLTLSLFVGYIRWTYINEVSNNDADFLATGGPIDDEIVAG